MKILAIETSSKLCGIALLEDTTLISKIEKNEGLTHSEILMPLLDDFFKQNNIKLSDIDLLACDIGPGSFTGIRIGVATVKAFSDSMNIPSIGVNSLECYAHMANSSGIICSIIDCKNNNCYFAVYEFENDTCKVLEEPQSNSIENCIELLKNKYQNIKITFTGDGSIYYKEIIDKNINNPIYIDNSLNSLDTYKLGYIAYQKAKSCNLSNLPPLLPLYLKKPQAEQQLESKNAKIEKMNITDLKLINFSEFDDFWNISNLEDDLLSENSEWYIIKIENKIIGFAGIKIVLDEADIMNIAINKNFRGQGFAFKLLSYIIEKCQNNNIKKINLEVNEKNIPAINLYKKLQFNEIGRRKNYYDGNDAILMSLILNK